MSTQNLQDLSDQTFRDFVVYSFRRFQDMVFEKRNATSSDSVVTYWLTRLNFLSERRDGGNTVNEQRLLALHNRLAKNFPVALQQLEEEVLSSYLNDEKDDDRPALKRFRKEIGKFRFSQLDKEDVKKEITAPFIRDIWKTFGSFNSILEQVNQARRFTDALQNWNANKTIVLMIVFFKDFLHYAKDVYRNGAQAYTPLDNEKKLFELLLDEYAISRRAFTPSKKSTPSVLLMDSETNVRIDFSANPCIHLFPPIEAKQAGLGALDLGLLGDAYICCLTFSGEKTWMLVPSCLQKYSYVKMFS